MTNTERIQANNAELQEILETVNALPEAGEAQGVDPLYYATSLYEAFDGAVFPDNTELVLRFQKPLNPVTATGGMYRTFAKTAGLKKLKIITDDTVSSWPLQQTFRENQSIEEIDLTECSRNLTNSTHAFWSGSLKRILGALDVSQCTDFTLMFTAAALEEVEFVPNTISKSISFRSGVLTQASVESIINGLVDLTGGTAQTLSLDLMGKNLTDDQKARIAAKNWTLSYW